MLSFFTPHPLAVAPVTSRSRLLRCRLDRNLRERGDLRVTLRIRLDTELLAELQEHRGQ
jgi:hypothetical protein